ncbi:ankyrin repeat domain-containing protein [Victivallis sp. Marseille-Q1083]|uniref:ankyrin repeat domain-containing protein n=1 Tax=Victivallis sp. Marseille-Q1083 TaxID=2717288 RepID=UPI00158C1820|nr:ankyrin repeat domain-containing protein [Victivallis sp. Marseille-Q1083]
MAEKMKDVLFEYIQQGKFEKAKQLIRQYPYCLNQFADDEYGSTVLRASVANHCPVEFIDFLKAMNYDFSLKNNKNNYPPLLSFPVFLDEDLCQKMVEVGCRLTPWEEACFIISYFRNQKEDQLDSLLKAHPEIAGMTNSNGENLLYISLRLQKFSYAELLLPFSALNIITSRNESLFGGLGGSYGILSLGSNEEIKNWYERLDKLGCKRLPAEQLFHFINYGNFDAAIAYLREHRYLVNGYIHNCCSVFHNVVFTCAKYNLDVSLIQEFIDLGVFINIPNYDGYTPIFSASRSQSVTELLIANGANVNIACGAGDRPLHTAARDRSEAIFSLIEAGAEINAVNNYGYTPLDLLNQYDDFREHFKLKKRMKALGALSGKEIRKMSKR